jgi:hypothetical protein
MISGFRCHVDEICAVLGYYSKMGKDATLAKDAPSSFTGEPHP